MNKMCIQEDLKSNARLQKTLKDFWINGSCLQYFQHKNLHRISRNGFHVLRLFTNHTSGTYSMLNLRMKYIVLSRDMSWLNKIYVKYI